MLRRGFILRNLRRRDSAEKKCIEELAAQEGYRLKVRDPTNYLEEKGEVEI